MSKSALDEFLGRKPTAPVAQVPAADAPAMETGEGDSEQEKDFSCYGTNRAARPVLMLDVRTLTGERVALAYSYLTAAFFDASGLLVLSFTSHDIRLEGRNLSPVYDAVLSHRLRYVQELNPDYEKDTPENKTFISKIGVETAT